MPFTIQVAMKSSYDIYYFEVHCLLHCLVDWENKMTKEEFKKFWEMIPKNNEFSINV